MSETVHYERAREHLEAVGLAATLTELDGVLDTAAREERAPAWVLDQLLTSERATRFERRVNANLKLSGIPARKTLGTFGYDAQPGVPAFPSASSTSSPPYESCAMGTTSSSSGPPMSASRTSPSASP